MVTMEPMFDCLSKKRKTKIIDETLLFSKTGKNKLDNEEVGSNFHRSCDNQENVPNIHEHTHDNAHRQPVKHTRLTNILFTLKSITVAKPV